MRKEHHFHLSIFLPLNAAGHQRLKYLSQKICFTNILTSSGWQEGLCFLISLNHSHQNEAFFNMLGITSTPIPCVDRGLGTSNKP
jgi:hypothetical protein